MTSTTINNIKLTRPGRGRHCFLLYLSTIYYLLKPSWQHERSVVQFNIYRACTRHRQYSDWVGGLSTKPIDVCTNYLSGKRLILSNVKIWIFSLLSAGWRGRAEAILHPDLWGMCSNGETWKYGQKVAQKRQISKVPSGHCGQQCLMDKTRLCWESES